MRSYQTVLEVRSALVAMYVKSSFFDDFFTEILGSPPKKAQKTSFAPKPAMLTWQFIF